MQTSTNLDVNRAVINGYLFVTLSLVGGDINILFSFMFLSSSHSRL